MFYIKNKELTKDFRFSEAFKSSELPGYIRHYVLEGENIWVAYKTNRDHGVFTEDKIVLFDSINKTQKQIYTIPYKSISTIAVTFEERSAELYLYLDCGYPIALRFVDMKPEDKIRLRILYTCINQVVCGKKPREVDIDRLVNDDVKFKK